MIGLRIAAIFWCLAVFSGFIGGALFVFKGIGIILYGVPLFISCALFTLAITLIYLMLTGDF
ncbi:MAG: hypothetical protein K0R66_1715 [Gammaproteobacteria bacterium]|nr:hypothetical protein [Gammaproteobacteria bacterium]